MLSSTNTYKLKPLKPCKHYSLQIAATNQIIYAPYINTLHWRKRITYRQTMANNIFNGMVGNTKFTSSQLKSFIEFSDADRANDRIEYDALKSRMALREQFADNDRFRIPVLVMFDSSSMCLMPVADILGKLFNDGTYSYDFILVSSIVTRNELNYKLLNPNSYGNNVVSRIIPYRDLFQTGKVPVNLFANYSKLCKPDIAKVNVLKVPIEKDDMYLTKHERAIMKIRMAQSGRSCCCWSEGDRNAANDSAQMDILADLCQSLNLKGLLITNDVDLKNRIETYHKDAICAVSLELDVNTKTYFISDKTSSAVRNLVEGSYMTEDLMKSLFTQLRNKKRDREGDIEGKGEKRSRTV